MHIVFSLLNTMYTPYAIVYYVQRVHLMCQVNSACTNLTVSDYLTPEILIMLFGTLLHIPIWFFILMILDVKKNGGKVSDALKVFKVGYSQLVSLITSKRLGMSKNLT